MEWLRFRAKSGGRGSLAATVLPTTPSDNNSSVQIISTNTTNNSSNIINNSITNNVIGDYHSNKYDSPHSIPIFMEQNHCQSLLTCASDLSRLIEPNHLLDENEWVAMHLVGLLGNVCALWDAISDMCNCNTMSGPPGYLLVCNDSHSITSTTISSLLTTPFNSSSLSSTTSNTTNSSSSTSSSNKKHSNNNGTSISLSLNNSSTTTANAILQSQPHHHHHHHHHHSHQQQHQASQSQLFPLATWIPSSHANSSHCYCYSPPLSHHGTPCTPPQAKLYIDSGLTHCHLLLSQSTVFPTRHGDPFPLLFRQQCNLITRRLFHCLIHFYWAHFTLFQNLELVAYLNTVCKHWLLFNAKFAFVDERELELLSGLHVVLLTATTTPATTTTTNASSTTTTEIETIDSSPTIITAPFDNNEAVANSLLSS